LPKVIVGQVNHRDNAPVHEIRVTISLAFLILMMMPIHTIRLEHEPVTQHESIDHIATEAYLLLKVEAGYLE